MFLASKLIDFSRRSVDFLYVFVTFSFRSFWFCSGSALHILWVLPANMKTSGEEFILEISSFYCSWKSSVNFLYFRELTELYKSFSNVSNSLHSSRIMFGLETVSFFNHCVTGIISIILEKVCFPAHSFNNAFNFVN